MESNGFVKVFERVPGRGEDAALCASWRSGLAGDPNASCVCAGVFDGLGGLGARSVATPAGPRSEAYVASRCARDALGAYAMRCGEALRASFGSCSSDGDVRAAVFEARARLETCLDDALVRLHDSAGGVLLPTNAALALGVRERGRDCVVALWAGDARCYLLDADEGLHQLSSDDNGTGADALDDLRGAAPAAQTSRLGYDVATSGGTRLSAVTVELGAPAVVLCCTDGAYSAGIRSPMHLELLLWRWVLAAASPDGLGPGAFGLMDAYWDTHAQDDCSLAGFAAGAVDDAWRERAQERMREVYAGYIAPFPAAPGPGADASRIEAYGRAVDELWARYKPGYVRYQKPSRQGTVGDQGGR